MGWRPKEKRHVVRDVPLSSYCALCYLTGTYMAIRKACCERSVGEYRQLLNQQVGWGLADITCIPTGENGRFSVFDKASLAKGKEN